MSEPMDTREEVELPPLEWREMLAYEPVRCIEETCALEHAGEYEIRAEREAQLKAALAANREQKAEIERANDRIRYIAQLLGVPDGGRYLNDWIAKSEKLSSLRASAGEKWIPCTQELPPLDKMVIVHGGIARRMEREWISETGGAAGRPIMWPITHWMHFPVAPPSLPTEEK